MRIKFLKANHGDCMIVSFNKKNILIDGGPSTCYYDANLDSFGELKFELDSIKLRSECIDLLILTHIDNDHICGLLKWFEMDDTASDLILAIWFNSGRIVSKTLSEPANDDLKVLIDPAKSPLTGVPEALEFEDYLIANKIWDGKVWKSGMTFQLSDFKIELISPEDEQLQKLIKEYKAKARELTTTGGKSSDWDLDLKTLIEDESKSEFKFEEDKSIKNGSSIAFILSTDGKRFLFLGDAHPTVIVNGLALLGYNRARPLQVEIVKLSHHGSSKNTSASLLEVIQSDNFFVSTNSAYHGHPGKRTLARILMHNPNASFFFNYEEVRDSVFTRKDRQDYQIKSIVKNEFYF